MDSVDIDASSFEVYNLLKEVERRAQENGLRITFRQDVKTAATDGQELIFPALDMPLTKDDLVMLKNMSIHEPLHIKRKEMYDIVKKNGVNLESKFGLLINAVEDEIMEHEHGLEYAGDLKDLNAGHNLNYNKFIKKIEDHPHSAFSKEHIEINTMFLMMGASRAAWDKSVSDVYERLVKASHPDAIKKVDALLTKGIIDKMTKIGGPQHSFDVAKEAYPYIFDGSPDDPENKMQPAPSPGASAGAEGDEGNEGDGDGSTSGKEGTDGGESCNDRPVIKYSDILKSAHTQEQKDNFNNGVDYSDKKCNRPWSPCPKQYIREMDVKKLQEDYLRKHVKDRSKLPGRATLANNVRRLLLVETKADFKNELSSGKLSPKNLYRLAVPTIGDGSWNAKVFKKRIDHDRLDTCISIVVDFSGSMSGEKMNVAANASIRLYEVFHNVLHMPVEILSFSTGHAELFHGIIKGFDERVVSGTELVRRYNMFANYTGGNADADAVLWAASRISKRPEKRKIIFMLSDGSPTDTWDNSKYDPDYGLKTVVSDIKRQKRIEIYGIGIQMHNISRYYGKDCKTIDDISQLDDALLQTMHNVVIKRHM